MLKKLFRHDVEVKAADGTSYVVDNLYDNEIFLDDYSTNQFVSLDDYDERLEHISDPNKNIVEIYDEDGNDILADLQLKKEGN